MHFRVQTDDMNHGMGMVSRALSARPIKQVFEGVFIETTVEGLLLTGTDGGITIVAAVPGIVEKYMEAVSKITGREYKLFSYYGAEDAERVIICMGSVTEAAREAIDYMNKKGEKVGMVSVHLYRPFSVKHLLAAVPKT